MLREKASGITSADHHMTGRHVLSVAWMQFSESEEATQLPLGTQDLKTAFFIPDLYTRTCVAGFRG
ncbi:hypothetical protein CBP31_06185 [Oceanisphaera profunda]|uniref:Uncharacterized protein n=1 Tax=Oceanisphaera profunda TaxID=1416627 RepID=A0A1Y0D4N1_9GAMM|nr:hypothetical protein CBP31_06185 [Oceanisphaera profunda]